MRKCLALLAVFGALLATEAHAQVLQRLSAQFLRFDGSETSSTTAATGTLAVPGTGGILAYTSGVFVPFASGPQTLYVTLSAVGDDHGGQPNYISCNVDAGAPGGVPTAASQVCEASTATGVDTAPPGWITMAHHFDYNISQYVDAANVFSGCTPASCGNGGGGLGDEHDNAYYYTWCKPIFTGTHIINLRMGNKTGIKRSRFGENTTVFFEKATVYIDVSDAPPFGPCTRAFIPPGSTGED